MSNRYRELSVELGERSYPIFIGEGLLGTQDLSAFVSGAQVMIVTNETVAPLYLERAKACFPGKRVDTVVLPDGEKFKDWQTLNSIFDGLLEHRHQMPRVPCVPEILPAVIAQSGFPVREMFPVSVSITEPGAR